MSSKKRVLFFDSGVGGLSIYKTCQEHFAEQIQYYYCSDNAFFPYSEKEEKELNKHIVETVTKIVEKYKIDLCVIACNTASTIVLDDLRDKLHIEIVGVVPAIKKAADLIRKKQEENKTIGLLATKGTINRDYTKNKLIKKYAKDIEVLSLGTTDLVIYAENELTEQGNQNLSLKTIFTAWLENSIPDYIVLGCTHFPLIKNQIQNIFPNSYLVDSNLAIMRRIASLLNLEENYHTVKDGYAGTLIFTKEFQQESLNYQAVIKKFNFTKIKILS